ncbi:hypothetical protein ABEB36_004512 [Hypothenemus hampei]|uniref:C-type lectin domain-containing protein n=1 Tax=Hypothenemus hampei TaxID=57062 RepID=A0ABD1F3J3_HYPHA
MSCWCHVGVVSVSCSVGCLLHLVPLFTLRSFVGAILACKQAGMQIATINSLNQQNLVESTIKEADDYSTNGYWIGAAAEVMYAEMEDFYWVNTGLKLTFMNWGSTQPIFNPFNLHTGICVRVGNYYKVNEPYLWENFDCNAEQLYICETDL